MAAVADRVDERRRDADPWAGTPGDAGPVASSWGLARLAALVAASPLLAPAVAAVAARTTARTLRLLDDYPAVIDAVLAGERPPLPDGSTPRVDRVPASSRWFVSSDLHRCVPGTVDWPGHQHTRRLYELALGSYAERSWGLIENGDVEDFWLAGGSAYGVVYDLTRLASGAWPGPWGRRTAAELAVGHLGRIVANNRAVYDLIEHGFHRHGRYRRLIGNHDDVLARPELRAALAEVHEGIEVLDHLVLEDSDGAGVGLVTHGHHVDSWNAPGHAWLGKLGTWLGSALLDAPLAGNPGIPDDEETATLLEGRLPDELTRVSRLFGANRDLYSVDESLLFDACRRHWAPDGARDLEGGPWLLLGHTHLPLVRPVDPPTGGVWERYVNSGSAVFNECLTGIEWDGSADPHRPEVRLVAWRYAERGRPVGDEAVVAHDGERAVVRDVLARVAPDRELAVIASGSIEATAAATGREWA